MDHGQHANPAIVTGRLIANPPVTPKDGLKVLSLPDTDYRLHLVMDPAPAVTQGRIRGSIHAQARRVDVVNTGGIFIEPVIGRPRRLQGRIIDRDAAANTITVKAVAPFICKLDSLQKAEQFPVGALVSFDVERGARFEPMK